jgi:hypothetical protein
MKKINTLICLAFLLCLGLFLPSPKTFGMKPPDKPNNNESLVTDSSKSNDTSIQESSGEPFAWGDFTWLNGNNRQQSALLDSKYFTGTFVTDVNYNYSFNNPIDHTNVGSTATFRENEFDLSFVGFGGDFHYGHARGRLYMQFGTRATGVPRNDFSVLRGQFQLDNAYRYISEAYGGYHWDVLHGINLDIGIFMSYVGLMSYTNFENWSYQPSYTSDNTPWFFHGARLQTFPSDRLKVELWLINGWQTYGMFNEEPGVGYQVLYRPNENISYVFNGYYGYDTPANNARLRVHSDNSLQVKYLNKRGAFISKAAFSLTGDLGFESGGGVTPFGGSGGPKQNFISGMLYNHIWFCDEHMAWNIGGGYMQNPGRYLVLTPTGSAFQTFTENPGDQFNAWDFSTTLQYMPDEYVTWELEYVHREANVPYFAGHGGVTSPNGFTNTPLTPDWSPDLVKAESRIIFALLFRM